MERWFSFWVRKVRLAVTGIGVFRGMRDSVARPLRCGVGSDNAKAV